MLFTYLRCGHEPCLRRVCFVVCVCRAGDGVLHQQRHGVPRGGGHHRVRRPVSALGLRPAARRAPCGHSGRLAPQGSRPARLLQVCVAAAAPAVLSGFTGFLILKYIKSASLKNCNIQVFYPEQAKPSARPYLSSSCANTCHSCV